VTDEKRRFEIKIELIKKLELNQEKIAESKHITPCQPPHPQPQSHPQ
jgi:hypothetical protein